MAKFIDRALVNNSFAPSIGTIGDPRVDDFVGTATPYLWLYEFTVPTDPVTRYRFVRHPVGIEWGYSLAGAKFMYSPWPVSHDEIRQDTQASLPVTTVRISNASLEIEEAMERYDFMGQECRISRILYKGPGVDDSSRLEDYRLEIQTSRITNEAVEMKCGLPNLVKAQFPSGRNRRLKCGHLYRGSRCQYSGTLPTCSRFEEGENGCAAHDNRARFGGKKGMPRDQGASF